MMSKMELNLWSTAQGDFLIEINRGLSREN